MSIIIDMCEYFMQIFVVFCDCENLMDVDWVCVVV